MEEQVGRDGFSCLTWNVWNNVGCDVALRGRLIAEQIGALDPDVLMLQEMTREMQAVLSPLLLRYPHSSQRPPQNAPYWTCVFSRFPLMHSVRVPFAGSTQGRDFVAGIVEMSENRRALICSSHLESLGSGSFERESQLNQILALQYDGNVSALKPVLCLFGGDTNLKERTDGPLNLPEQWLDLWEVHHGKDGDANGATRNADRIDRFFASAVGFRKWWTVHDIKVVGKATAYSQSEKRQLAGSDHLAVLVRFGFELDEAFAAAVATTDTPEKIVFKRPDGWMKYI